MAREFGRILLSIWSDTLFIQLDSRAQRVYLMLLSQPGVNLCGVQSYAPRRWATLAPDTTTRSIGQAVAILEQARLVAVDPSTEELLIRSYLRHDKAIRTTNVAKSLVTTFEQIASPCLARLVLVELHRVHDELRDNGWPGWKVPELVDLLRRPFERPSERPFERPSERPFERPSERLRAYADGNPNANGNGNDQRQPPTLEVEVSTIHSPSRRAR